MFWLFWHILQLFVCFHKSAGEIVSTEPGKPYLYNTELPHGIESIENALNFKKSVSKTLKKY